MPCCPFPASIARWKPSTRIDTTTASFLVALVWLCGAWRSALALEVLPLRMTSFLVALMWLCVRGAWCSALALEVLPLHMTSDEALEGGLILLCNMAVDEGNRPGLMGAVPIVLGKVVSQRESICPLCAQRPSLSTSPFFSFARAQGVSSLASPSQGWDTVGAWENVGVR